MSARVFQPCPENEACRTGTNFVASCDLHDGFDPLDFAVKDNIDAPDRMMLGGCLAMDTARFTFATPWFIRDGWRPRGSHS